MAMFCYVGEGNGNENGKLRDRMGWINAKAR